MSIKPKGIHAFFNTLLGSYFLTKLRGSACPVLDGEEPLAFAGDWLCWRKIGRMKNRNRKKQITKARKLPTQFVKDTLRAMAEVKAGKLTPYKFNSEDRA